MKYRTDSCTTLRISTMWPSRDELLRLMGMDDTQHNKASYLQDLLSTPKHQREANPDAKDMKGECTGYYYAALSMFTFTFHSATEPYYDRRRECLWYLGWRVGRSINCAIPSDETRGQNNPN
jgi:hypothetical protein